MDLQQIETITKGLPVITHLHCIHARTWSDSERRIPAAYALRFLLFVCLAVTLTACGNREEATPTPTATATPVATPTLNAADAVMEVVTVEPTPIHSLANTSTPLTDTAGTTVTQSAPVVVEESANCPVEPDLDLAGYPDLEERLGCPLDTAFFESVAINEFGGGPDYDRFMLWFSWEGNIYVLLPDRSWASYPDTWSEDQPTFACNPLQGDPESPPLPRRGFGKLWCEEPGLQEIMGLVDREERLCQHTVVQEFEGMRMIACFEDATIRYFQIFDDNTWALDQQP